jgi:hypothetical protein
LAEAASTTDCALARQAAASLANRASVTFSGATATTVGPDGTAQAPRAKHKASAGIRRVFIDGSRMAAQYRAVCMREG